MGVEREEHRASCQRRAMQEPLGMESRFQGGWPTLAPAMGSIAVLRWDPKVNSPNLQFKILLLCCPLCVAEPQTLR